MTNKYKKPVGKRKYIDVYDVCDIWQVDDPSGAIQHAIKKLLCNGERGYKPAIQDYREAIGSIQRKIELMEAAEGNKEPIESQAVWPDEARIEAIGQNGNNGEHYPQNGKPSWDDAPEWANWLAQDEIGDWFWYERKPENADDDEFWFSDYDFELASDGEENPSWRNTLETRPQ